MNKNRRSPPKNGYCTSKMPMEHQFAHKNHKEDILYARFHQRKTFRVSKPLSANFICCDDEENCVFLCFGGILGVKTHLFDG